MYNRIKSRKWFTKERDLCDKLGMISLIVELKILQNFSKQTKFSKLIPIN